MTDTPVFVMTIDRESLPRLLDSLRGAKTVMIRGPWAMTQIARNASALDSELIAVADDDAIAPESWLDIAKEAFSTDPKLGYVSGPLIDDPEKPAQIVQQSFLGSFLMRDRYRHGEDGDGQDRLPGMGVFRRSAYLAAMKGAPETQARAPGTGQDIRLEGWLIEHGWKVLYLNRMAVKHESRKTLRAFLRQKFKDGEGRATYLRRFPKEAVRKPYFFLPTVLLALTFAWPYGPIGLALYVAAVTVTTRRLSLVPWFLANHAGYGVGMLWGLLKP